MTWVSLGDLSSSPLVQTLNVTRGSIQGVISTVQVTLQAAKAIAEILLKLANDLNDAQALAIKVAVNAMLAIIDEIEKNLGLLYVLGVPPVEINQVVQDWGGVAEITGQALTLSDGSRVELEGSGGNAGFIRTVANSFQDFYDDNRPQFNNTAKVGGAVFLVGADTYYQAIKLIKKLQSLFSPISVDDVKVPRAKNLQAVPAVPTDAGSRYAVKLSWTPAPKLAELLMYGSTRYEIREVVIYKGLLNEPLRRANLASYEIARFVYTGLESTYIDQSFFNELDQPAWAYYGVGLLLNEVYESGAVVELTEPIEITRAAVCVGQPLRKNMGVSPDWVSLTLFDLVPQLGTIFAAIRQFLEELLAKSDAGSSQIQAFIDLLDQQLNKYSAFAEEILETIKEIVDLFTFPTGYFGVFVIPPTDGGNDAFIGAISKALTDTSDPLRPPFDKGTEIVAGAVVMGGANSPEALLALNSTIGLIETIFSGTGNAAAAAARAINDASAAAEAEVCLNDARIKSICETVEASATTFGDDLQPALEEPLCKA